MVATRSILRRLGATVLRQVQDPSFMPKNLLPVDSTGAKGRHRKYPSPIALLAFIYISVPYRTYYQFFKSD